METGGYKMKILETAQYETIISAPFEIKEFCDYLLELSKNNTIISINTKDVSIIIKYERKK